MRILINDKAENKERMIAIFKHGGYERNNLVFVHNYEEYKTFVENQLINNQAELDLIITNNHLSDGYNALKAQALLFHKNTIDEAYSNGHFRISSIPIILFSHADNKSELQGLGFDAIVKDNESHQHAYLVQKVEEIIRSWRQKLITDLDNIGLKPGAYSYFKNKTISQLYHHNYGHNYQRTFYNSTCILSKEFIANPTHLHYKWLQKNFASTFEAQIEAFGKMFRYHVKYDRNNNERTILHRHINDNTELLKRGAFSDIAYELQLKEKGDNEKQICDYLLKTDMPELLATTFFEVKKETVQLLANKHRKHPKLSEEVNRHLEQLDDYQLYTEVAENSGELARKIGYGTKNYNFQLLAGRLEEKEEFLDLFNSKLQRRFKGIEVFTFEDFENINYTYLEKLQKLQM